MISSWSTNLEDARLRHRADVAKAERFRLVRRSRRAKRRVAAEVEAPSAITTPASGTIVSLPVRPAPAPAHRPDRLAS